MDILDKIRFLTDKQIGLGIPMRTIGKYLGCHPTTVTYYLEGKQLSPETRQKYEQGINRLIQDFNEKMG